MEINSPYRDYYDFVGHIHGRDTKHQYVRRHFENPKMASDIDYTLTFVATTSIRLGLVGPSTQSSWYGRVSDVRTHDDHGNPLPPEERDRNRSRLSMYDTQWIAVAGKIYSVFGRKGLDPFEREAKQKKRGVWAEDEAKAYTLLSPTHPMWEVLSDAARGLYSQPRENADLIHLHRKLQAPVFHILDSSAQDRVTKKYQYIIPYRLPILQEHGFADVVDPYQLYQDLEYFIANTMNESPDMMPPTKMTDKEKIAAAGFDPVQSFRHRKG